MNNRIAELTGAQSGNGNQMSERSAVSPARAVARLAPYKVVNQKALFLAERQGASKLDWNESTREPSAEIMEAIIAALNNGGVHWYPDVNSSELIRELSRYCNLEKKYIQTFPGSDAALEYVSRAFLDIGDEVIIAGPTYDNFRIYAESCGAVTVTNLGPSPFVADVSGLIDSITDRTKIIYIVTPNNPTGVVFSERDMRRILEAAPRALVISDEAYFEFCGETHAPLIQSYPNLLVSRSFSKAFGLAGLRCGYVLSDQRNIETLNRIRVGKNLSAPAQAAAIAALRNLGDLESYVKTVRENTVFLGTRLGDLGITAIPTVANFVMAQVASPAQVIEFLESQQIYIRDRSYLPQLENFIRITVGDDQRTRQVVDAFSAMPREYYQMNDNKAQTLKRKMERISPSRKITLKRLKETPISESNPSEEALDSIANPAWRRLSVAEAISESETEIATPKRYKDKEGISQ